MMMAKRMIRSEGVSGEGEEEDDDDDVDWSTYFMACETVNRV